jgi:hypothetical protein
MLSKLILRYPSINTDGHKKASTNRWCYSLVVAESGISWSWSRSATTTSLCPSILCSLTVMWLTTWCRILSEILLVPQLVNKFPKIFGTSRFITVHMSFSRSRWIQFTPFQPISWRKILISCTHLCLDHPSCLFSLGFFHQNTTHFSFLPHAVHSRPL